jgi:signal transduction histidine kinase
MSDGFRFSPDILARLGEELVPDADQGIVELAKNAYDADATVCTVRLVAVHSGAGTISIDDNGIGMTAGTIREGWLVIGRSAKRQKAVTELFRRVPAGDKGLGRLAALRLGKRVLLRTRPIAEPGVEYHLTIDWDAFSTAEHVEDVAIDLQSFETDLGPGTDIVIEQVSTRFGRSAVNRLARSLLLLSDPFHGAVGAPKVALQPMDSNTLVLDPGFKARLETPEFADLAAKVANSYFGDAQYRIAAKVDGNGGATFRLLDWKGDLLHEKSAGETYQAPALTFDLWVFILDAQTFSTRTSTVGEVRDWLSEVGGVHIYEDGIRVPPYGGSGNDWLEMNLRRVRSPEGRPSTNNSIGLVRLSNPTGMLVQKTDRNGYIENEAFRELRRVCTDCLDWAARIQVRERDERRQAEKEAIKLSSGKAEEQLAKVLNRTVSSTQRRQVEQAIAQVVKDSGVETRSLRDELQLYRSLATAGMTSAVFVHEIGRPLSMIDQAISSLQRLIPDDKRGEAERRIEHIARAKQRLNSFLSIPLTLLAKRKRRSGRVSVNSCVRELVTLLEPINQFFKVEVELDLTEAYTDINGSEALIDGICLNLVINALNAFQREDYSQPRRVVRVKTRHDGSHVMLIVEDNAGGIEGVDIKDIWLPGVTTSQEGTGFGLTIVRDSVVDLGGTIDVIAKSDFGGARFVVRFPPMRTLY